MCIVKFCLFLFLFRFVMFTWLCHVDTSNTKCKFIVIFQFITKKMQQYILYLESHDQNQYGMVMNRTKLKYMEGDYACKSFPYREFLSSYDFKTNMMFIIIFLVYFLSIIKLFIFVIYTIADT